MSDTEHSIKITPIIRQRYSSKFYDSEKRLDKMDILSLLEAARWAPSSGNGQPWRYIIFPKDEPDIFMRGLVCLNEDNQIWAQHASLLILAVAQEIRPNGKINGKALHDLGLANENLLLQAIDLGFRCRPMGGFNVDKAKEDFNIPDGFRPVVMIAVGLPGEEDDLPTEILAEKDNPRLRNPIDQFAFRGSWDEPLSLQD